MISNLLPDDTTLTTDGHIRLKNEFETRPTVIIVINEYMK